MFLSELFEGLMSVDSNGVALEHSALWQDDIATSVTKYGYTLCGKYVALSACVVTIINGHMCRQDNLPSLLV